MKQCGKFYYPQAPSPRTEATQKPDYGKSVKRLFGHCRKTLTWDELGLLVLGMLGLRFNRERLFLPISNSPVSMLRGSHRES